MHLIKYEFHFCPFLCFELIFWDVASVMYKTFGILNMHLCRRPLLVCLVL